MADTTTWLKGQLLLDGGRLHGSFFHRTVVLICEHNAEGAFGLVLNRLSGSTVGEMIQNEIPEALKTEPLFLGGPVQTNALSYLHSDSYLPQANVLANLSLGHSLESLSELGSSFSPTKQIRIFAGYAGWSPGQLEEEMKRGSWLTHPASANLVFQPDPASLWKNILSEMGWKYRLLSQAPDDLSWN